MEKVIYILTGADGDRLLAGVDALTAAGATMIQINVVDDAVTPAVGLRMVHEAPAPDAFVSVWLPTAYAPTREPVDVAVRAVAGDGASVTAHLVTESCPLDADATHPVEPGRRTPGFAQIALLRRPADQSHGDFLAAWLDHHTQVAIDTQSTFGYTQHVTVRALTVAGDTTPDTAADPVDGIVEECFPEAAMSDPHVFFDALDDGHDEDADTRLAEHTSRMIASTSAFLDFARIDVIPTSRYVFG